MEENKNSNVANNTVGEGSYLNKNCWLVKNLKYSPYKRCQYCDLKFRNCIFLEYQIISLVLIILVFLLFYFFEGHISPLTITVIFVFVIIYGYFFNRSTEKIIRSNFSLKKAKSDLRKLSDGLEDKVREQTSDIRQKNKELVELDRMKDEFLQMATHELNTPITVIQGKLSMAVDEDMCHLDDKQKEFFRPILSDTMRLANLSKDILNVARIDQHRLVINPVETDIGALIEQIVSDFKVKAQGKNNSVGFIKLSKALPHLTIDQGKIGEVITNLINNANKFTENGKIIVTAKQKDDEVIISVADTGIGIDPKDQKHLFEKFYQAARFDPNNPQEQQGSGLGLYISDQIIRLHGGKIWLESEKGKGSTFYFSLPLEYNGFKEPANLHISDDKLRVL